MPLFRRGNSLNLDTKEQKQEEKKEEALPFVTPTQLNDFGSTIRTEVSGIISNAVSELRGAFSSFQQPAGQQRQEPQIEDVSEEDYQQALSTGDAQTITKRQRANDERNRRNTQREINQARAEVTPVLESLSGELAGSILATLEYYPLFKKDVDSLLGTIPPAQRNRSVIEHIYHSVCGRPENLTKIQEYKTGQQRQRDLEVGMASDIGTQRRGNQREREVTFESTFGEEISNPTATLQTHGPIWQGRRRGYDAENYAKDVGFKDKNEFARFAHAVMAVEDCPECLSPIIQGKCAAYCKMNKRRSG